MAKFTVKAGAEIDTLTKKELDDSLAAQHVNWMREVARGIRYRRFSAFGIADGAGLVRIGEGDQIMGPRSGFVWLLQRISVTAYDPTTQNLALYQGSIGSGAIIVPNLLTTQTGMDEFLDAGDTLLVSGTVTAGAKVWVTGQAREAPESLAWKLQ